MRRVLLLPSRFPLCSQGEVETDLTGDELVERAVAGLKATIPSGLREAWETGADDAEKSHQSLKIVLKNIFDAPAPPEGATGEDGKYGLLAHAVENTRGETALLVDVARSTNRGGYSTLVNFGVIRLVFKIMRCLDLSIYSCFGQLTAAGSLRRCRSRKWWPPLADVSHFSSHKIDTAGVHLACTKIYVLVFRPCDRRPAAIMIMIPTDGQGNTFPSILENKALAVVFAHPCLSRQSTPRLWRDFPHSYAP